MYEIHCHQFRWGRTKWVSNPQTWMLYFAAVNLLESFLGAYGHIHPPWVVGVCVVVCMILSSNISGMAFIHSVSVQENFQVTNSLRMDPNRTEDRTFKRNYYIIIWVEFGETLHFDPVLKTGNRLGDVQNGYHSHCAPIIQLSLLLFRWKRKRINHVESVKPCPCRSSLSLLVVVVRFLGHSPFEYYNLCPHISVFPGLSYFKACDAFGTFNLINWFNLLGPKTTLRNMNWKSSSARLLLLLQVVLCGRLGLLPTTTLYSALKSYECRRHWIYYSTDLND